MPNHRHDGQTAQAIERAEVALREVAVVRAVRLASARLSRAQLDFSAVLCDITQKKVKN